MSFTRFTQGLRVKRVKRVKRVIEIYTEKKLNILVFKTYTIVQSKRSEKICETNMKLATKLKFFKKRQQKKGFKII